MFAAVVPRIQLGPSTASRRPKHSRKNPMADAGRRRPVLGLTNDCCNSADPHACVSKHYNAGAYSVGITIFIKRLLGHYYPARK